MDTYFKQIEVLWESRHHFCKIFVFWKIKEFSQEAVKNRVQNIPSGTTHCQVQLFLFVWWSMANFPVFTSLHNYFSFLLFFGIGVLTSFSSQRIPNFSFFWGFQSDLLKIQFVVFPFSVLFGFNSKRNVCMHFKMPVGVKKKQTKWDICPYP